MIYMIHSCNSRLWYVNRYLIPDMLAQGIPLESIILFNDFLAEGNQKAFYNSCVYIKNNLSPSEGIWHLTDDVIVSYDFYHRTSRVPNNLNIRCGFVTNAFNPRNKKYTGTQPFSKVWRSFPCIYIPNKYLAEFVDWYDAYDPTKTCYKRVKKEFEGGKDDDTLFLAFITNKHPSIRTVNITPNLVDHIDYLIGGSTLFSRKQKIHRACYLSDIDKNRVRALADKLK